MSSDPDREEGTALLPRFDENGLISAIVADEKTGEILMLAHMSAEALARTIETREGWFWSRSRIACFRSSDSLSFRDMYDLLPSFRPASGMAPSGAST